MNAIQLIYAKTLTGSTDKAFELVELLEEVCNSFKDDRQDINRDIWFKKGLR